MQLVVKDDTSNLFKILLDSNLENSIYSISPCGSMAAIYQERLITITKLRRKRNKSKNFFTHYCAYNVEDLQWSADSKFLLLISREESWIEIVQPENPDWLYHTKGIPISKIVSSIWTPDNKFVVSVSEQNILTVVHPIEGGSPLLFPGICQVDTGKLLFDFSNDSAYLACIQSSSNGHQLVLISLTTWKIRWKAKLDCVLVSGISWSPNSSLIAVWDHSTRYCIHFFGLDGSIVNSIQSDDPSRLGITSLSFSHQIFAVCCAEGHVEVYNSLTWQCAAVLNVPSPDELKSLFNNGALINFEGEIENNFDVPSFKSKLDSSIRSITFSCCGRLLAIANTAFVALWDINAGCILRCLMYSQLNSSLYLSWHPSQLQLAVVSSISNQILLWRGVQEGPCPDEFSVTKVATPCYNIFNVKWFNRGKVIGIVSNCKAAVCKLKKLIK